MAVKKVIKLILGIGVPLVLLFSLFLGACAPSGGGAVKPEDFYKDKVVKLVVAAKAGGGTDTLSRIFAPFLQQYLGARAVVVENNDAAGGMAALNMLWSSGPDGLMLATSSAETPVVSEFTNPEGIQFKTNKFFIMGGITQEIGNFLTVKVGGPYKSIADLKAKKEVKVGCGYGQALVSAVMADIIGLNARITPGLSTSDATLALERGETDYFSSSPGGTFDGVKNKTLLPLASATSKRHFLFPDVPALPELGKLTSEQNKWLKITDLRDSGKYIFVGPEVAKNKVEYLQSIFAKIDNDPKYKEEKRAKFQRWPMPEPSLTGPEATKLLLVEFYDLVKTEYGPMNDYLSKKYYTVK